jgi:hypothetical protein
MTTKPAHYFWIILLALLTACGNSSQATEMTKIQNTALAMARTGIALTQTAMPTATPTNTPTALPTATTTPTLEPTFPSPPILTPDAIQVERWREYQAELAKLVLSDSGVANPIYADALCEWDILGRSKQEVYVWAICGNFNSGGKRPAVIYLQTDGSIQKVIAAGFKGLFYNLDLFPADVQTKINLYSSGGGRADEMGAHLGYRLTHPEEPPLVVLSVIQTLTPPATATATQPIFPIHIILTPDTIQVERWKEYQAELAKVLLSFPPPERRYDPEEYKKAICEWDVLGRSGQEVYVWAACASTDGLWHPTNPAVIYLKPDGSIREVNVAIPGTDSNTQLEVYDLHLFPIDVQKKLCLYYFGWASKCNSIIPGYVVPYQQPPREGVLISHLRYREGYAEEPPLIILSAMPTATPIP